MQIYVDTETVLAGPFDGLEEISDCRGNDWSGKQGGEEGY